MKRAFFQAIILLFCTAGLARAATVKLAWDPCGDPKVVGYKVHYGTETRNYSKTLDVKGRLEARAAVSELEDGKAYFFAVTAYYGNGKESAYSEEVSTGPEKGAAQVEKGVKAPEAAKTGSPPPVGPATTVPVAKDSKIPPRGGLDGTQGKIPPSRKLPDASQSKPPLEPWEDTRIPPSKKF